MSIYLFEQVERDLKGSAQTSYKLYGRAFPEEGVFQIVASRPAAGLAEIGIAGGEAPEKPAPGILFHLAADAEGKLSCRHFRPADATWELCGFTLVREQTDLFSRQKGILESDLLRGKKVVVVGVGTLGGNVAHSLARSGVGEFVLIDPDELGVGNICRHVLDLRDIGRKKVEALAEKMRLRNPTVKVRALAKDFKALEQGEIDDLFAGCDLIVCGADDLGAKRRINRLAWERGVASLFVDAYERAFGGDITYAVPEWETPCYECIFSSIYQNMAAPRRTGVIDYAEVDDVNQLKAEPGLGVDIDTLTAVTAKVALALVVRDRLDLDIVKVLNPDATIYFWGNKQEYIFEYPFQVIFGNTRRNDQCPVCGRKHERQDGEQAKKLQELLGTIPSA